MKTILAATDFSQSANNAVFYAAELAKSVNAKLILFHAFHVPVPVSEVQIPVIDYDLLEEENNKMIQSLKDELVRKYDNSLKIECTIKTGFAVEEISAVDTDLVVMGIKGTGKLSEVLIGSSALGVIKHAKCPVLVVPENKRFKQIKRIVFAADHNEMKDKSVFTSLGNFARLFNAEIILLHVVKEGVESISETIEGIKLETYFEGVKHSKQQIKDETLVHGINEFVKNNDVDMVAMLPRKHNVFQRLFTESNTKKMAFHSEVPVLALV